jgi:hypothetical protein
LAADEDDGCNSCPTLDGPGHRGKFKKFNFLGLFEFCFLLAQTLSVLATLMNAVMAFIIWKTIKRSRCLCANNNNANGRRRRRRQVPDATSADGESEQQTVAAALAFARLWPIGFVKLLLTVGIYFILGHTAGRGSGLNKLSSLQQII